MTEKHFEIRAVAENTVFNRSAAFILNGDGEFVDQHRDGREYANETDAIATFESYATQETANAFTAHTNVAFELVVIWEELEEVHTKIVRLVRLVVGST